MTPPPPSGDGGTGVAMIFQRGGGGGEQSADGREGRGLLKIRVSKWHAFLHIKFNCRVSMYWLRKITYFFLLADQ